MKYNKHYIMNKKFEDECVDGFLNFNPKRSFEERCEIVRRTSISLDMPYEERLRMLKSRFGL